ncbi:PadR family transcriptional regulator [Nocardia sp. NPDC050697]|uniref:PadR family transcriptional regulator n=1 Tax=Nocardia sp. NPDC050697 TaxID=3155158 RepID=UPI00340AACDA
MTGTTYAVLGLLAVQPWSSYELTRQMERSLGRIWPRAQSRLYEEPKKLVALGFATAEDEVTGRRTRTVYTITEEGRAALARWLTEPGEGPVLEFEQLVQLSFADQGAKRDALRTIAAARSWAEQRNAENAAVAELYARGEGPFQYRAATTMLAGAFFTEFYAMVARWADWAGEQARTWPDDPADAVADPAQLAEIARRAAWDPGSSPAGG